MKIHTSSPKGLLGPRSVGADRGHFIYRIVILEFSAEFRAIKLGDWRFVSKNQSFSVHPVGLEPTTFGSEDRRLSFEPRFKSSSKWLIIQHLRHMNALPSATALTTLCDVLHRFAMHSVPDSVPLYAIDHGT